MYILIECRLIVTMKNILKNVTMQKYIRTTLYFKKEHISEDKRTVLQSVKTNVQSLLC